MQALGPDFKMNPYAAEYGASILEAKLKPRDACSDEASTATASSEYIANMDAKYKALQEALLAKDDVIASLRQQVEQLTLASRAEASTVPRPEPVEAPAPVDEPVEPQVVTSAAARQRLRRLCERRLDGSLAVPEDVHAAWKAGGSSREGLLKVYVGAGHDKASFLREIQHETRRSKELKVEVTGDFFTEEEMREELKLSERLSAAILEGVL